MRTQIFNTLLVFILSGISQLGFAQVCTNNVLQNPSFENNLVGWDGNGGVTSTTSSGGTLALKLCIGSNVRQMMPTTAGKNFTLTFKARTETTGANQVLGYIKYLSAGFEPLVTELYTYQTTVVYTQGTTSIIAPIGTAWMEVGFLKNTDQCVLIDEVCLSEAGAVNPCLPDVTAPVFTTCPVAQNLTTLTTTATATWVIPTATDACAGVVTLTTTHASGTSFPLGVTNVVYTARDAANNASTCGFAITVIQTVTPTCAIAATVSNVVCNNQGTPTITTDDTYTFDVLVTQNANCSPSWVSVSPALTGAYNVVRNFGPFLISGGNKIIQFRDAINATATVSVTATAPSTCSTGTQTCTNNLLKNPGFEGNLTDWDGTGGVISTTAAAGINSVKLCSGNNLRQTFAASVISADQSLRFKARTETTGANQVLVYIKCLSASWQVLSTDFLDFNTTAIYADGTLIKPKPTGTAWVEIGFFKATAGCVLIDEVCLTEVITGPNPCLTDVIPPVIAACPAAINVTVPGTSSIVNWTPPTATDGCPGAVTMTSTHSPGASFPIGATAVTYTAKDAANNTSTCRFVVTVTQSTGACPSNIVINPSFETDFASWEVLGTTISPTASSGTKSAKLCINAYMHQIYPAVAGQTMRLTFSARTETNTNDLISGYIKYLASNYQPISTDYFHQTTTGSFTQATFTKTAPVGTFFVEIGFYKPVAGCVLVDEVCFSLVVPSIPIIPPPPAVCTTNKLVNGGFETELTGWNGAGSLVSTIASLGTKSAKICQGAIIHQYFPATAGQIYGLLFKARNEAAGSDFISGYIKYMSSSFQPISTEYIHPSVAGTFVQAKLSKTAPPGTAYIEVGLFKPTLGCVLVDEVCLSLLNPVAMVIQSTELPPETEAVVDAQLYPNPATDFVHLNTKNLLDKEQVHITIIDTKGLIVKELTISKVNSEIESISLEDFQSGFYIVRTEVPGFRPNVAKLLVQRM
jgi:HYR domain/Secretion system C-terminal sorting domain